MLCSSGPSSGFCSSGTASSRDLPPAAGSRDAIGVSFTTFSDLDGTGVSKRSASPGEESASLALPLLPKRTGGTARLWPLAAGAAFLAMIGEDKRWPASSWGSSNTVAGILGPLADVAWMLSSVGFTAAVDLPIMFANFRGMVDEGITDELDGIASNRS